MVPMTVAVAVVPTPKVWHDRAVFLLQGLLKVTPKGILCVFVIE